MTPEERAKNARILFESVNRSTTINRRSFENIVTSAIREAVAAERTRMIDEAVAWVRTHHHVHNSIDGNTVMEMNPDTAMDVLADALAAHLAQNGGG